jgi:hypothetical protein
MPTAPMWAGARLAAVGTAEGLGASMTVLYGPVGAATQLARYVRCTFESGNASRSDRQKYRGSIPFSQRGTLLEKAKQNQNLILAKGAQGRC